MPLTVVSDINPIKVTGATSTDTEIKAGPSLTHVRFIRWYNAATIGDLVHITDGNGITIMKMRAEFNNDTQMWPIYTSYSGIRCDDLDSGELYIHIT